MGSLCGVGVFGLIECSHSLPALHSGFQIIIIIIYFKSKISSIFIVFYGIIKSVNKIFVRASELLQGFNECVCVSAGPLAYRNLRLMHTAVSANSSVTRMKFVVV